jgi:hypothetical protein
VLKETAQAENCSKVSYLIAEVIAKRGNPSVDGEVVKEYLQCPIDFICPAQKQAVSHFSLSKGTASRRIEDLSENIFSTFKSKCLNFVLYSVDMDESTDTTDAVQLAIFVCRVDENLKKYGGIGCFSPC